MNAQLQDHADGHPNVLGSSTPDCVVCRRDARQRDLNETLDAYEGAQRKLGKQRAYFEAAQTEVERLHDAAHAANAALEAAETELREVSGDGVVGE